MINFLVFLSIFKVFSSSKGKFEWKVISFALSTLQANAGQDLDCYGEDAEKMKEALWSAEIKVAGRSY